MYCPASIGMRYGKGDLTAAFAHVASITRSAHSLHLRLSPYQS